MKIRELFYSYTGKFFREWPCKTAAVNALGITMDELNRRLADPTGYKTSQGRYVYEAVPKGGDLP